MGTTVVSTIHSPTEESFELFDDLLLLVDGRTVYFGAILGEAVGMAPQVRGPWAHSKKVLFKEDFELFSSCWWTGGRFTVGPYWARRWAWRRR